MIRRVFLVFIVCFCQLKANENLSINPSSKNAEILSLQGEDHFLVYYAFEEQESSLKDVMIASLKKIGTVYSGDISKLSDKEKEERIKPGPMMEVVFSSLIEEKTYSSVEHTKLPVMELSFQVLAGAEILKNGRKQGCILWNQNKFLGTDSKEFKGKVLKTFESMMDQFIKDYQKANSDKKVSEVRFYLYS